MTVMLNPFIFSCVDICLLFKRLTLWVGLRLD